MGGKGGLILLQINNTKRNKKNMSASESEEVLAGEQLLAHCYEMWSEDAVKALNAKRVTKIREGADPDIEEPLMTVWNAAISDCVKELRTLHLDSDA